MPLIDRTIRALLVEDDYDIAAGLGAFLEPRGVTLDYAYTAQSARALISEAIFDVVVLDVQLPDGDGIELCQELKSHGLRSPVLLRAHARHPSGLWKLRLASAITAMTIGPTHNIG